MNVSKHNDIKNPFGSRFLTCVAVTVAVSIGSAGLASAAPGSGGHGAGNGGGHAGPAAAAHSGVSTPGAHNGGTPGFHSGPSFSAPSHSAPAQSVPGRSIPSPSGPSHSAPAQSAPAYSAPGYSAPGYSVPGRAEHSVPGAAADAGVPRMIPVPPPGAAFTQWLGDGAMLWNIMAPPVQPDPQKSVAPNNSKGGCNATRPQCN